MLVAQNLISQQTSNNLRNFWNMRNLAVNENLTEDEGLLRVIESGISILRTLQAIPDPRATDADTDDGNL